MEKNLIRWDDEQLKKIKDAITNYPLDSNITHPAEQYILEALAKAPYHADMDQLYCHLADFFDTNFDRGVILIILGRIGLPKTFEARVSIIEKALKSDDIKIRDSAIHAIELWDDKSLVPWLTRYKESEQWLEDYKNKVAEDLSNKTESSDEKPIISMICDKMGHGNCDKIEDEVSNSWFMKFIEDIRGVSARLKCEKFENMSSAMNIFLPIYSNYVALISQDVVSGILSIFEFCELQHKLLDILHREVQECLVETIKADKSIDLNHKILLIDGLSGK